jgi:hypothetical protein
VKETLKVVRQVRSEEPCGRRHIATSTSSQRATHSN